jgi:DNA-binding MarR family transcriptional regulator
MNTPLKYDRILELITLWQEFEAISEKQGKEGYDFANFAVWLSRRVHDDKRVSADMENVRQSLEKIASSQLVVHSKMTGKAKKREPIETSQEWIRAQAFEGKVKSGEEDVLRFHKYLPLESQIAALLTRMNRFSMFYTKKAFQGLEISNATEFGILAGIKSLENPRKTDVINLNLLEKTTGTELLKRMVQDGLVSETDDEEDKRSKRVRLTRKGTKLVEEATKRLWEMSAIVTGNLTGEQKHELAQMLNELEDFHNDIYFHQNDLSVEEILERNVLKIGA